MIFVVVVVDIYIVVWFCTYETIHICLFAVLFVWSFTSASMLRADTVSYCRSICRRIQSKSESTMLAVNFIFHKMKLNY